MKRGEKLGQSFHNDKSDIAGARWTAANRHPVPSSIGSKGIGSGGPVRIRSHLHTIGRYPAAGRLISICAPRYRPPGVLMTDALTETTGRPRLH